MLKKLLPALVAFVIFGLLPIFALGAPSYQARFVIGRASYEADGQVKQMDAAAFVENGRTYVPVRYLALALGVAEEDIIWDGKARTVTLTLDGVTLKLTIGGKTLYVNGEAKQMDVAPVIKSGRTYLPARWVAEAFGYEVHWDEGAKAVLVCPPGQVVEPEPQPAGSRIDWSAAKSGALQPPANAIAPPDRWGFPAKAVRMEFKVGSRYAKVTRPDGNAYTLDLGTPCVVVGNPIGVDSLKKQYPAIYNDANSIPLPGADYGAFYVPFIPVAEAFGVPRENIAWDGEHLAVFGYYGNTENYRVLMPGTREAVCKVVGNNPEVGLGQCEFPLFVKDGVPMVGINSTSDIYGMLFMTSGGNTPNLINAMGGASWNYETGTAMAIVTND
ncbi:MAG: copper amine oxidase N-terminal domain-containing protein [Bacillota bacterium]